MFDNILILVANLLVIVGVYQGILFISDLLDK